jgi:hypothetical protein
MQGEAGCGCGRLSPRSCCRRRGAMGWTTASTSSCVASSGRVELKAPRPWSSAASAGRSEGQAFPAGDVGPCLRGRADGPAGRRGRRHRVDQREVDDDQRARVRLLDRGGHEDYMGSPHAQGGSWDDWLRPGVPAVARINVQLANSSRSAKPGSVPSSCSEVKRTDRAPASGLAKNRS